MANWLIRLVAIEGGDHPIAIRPDFAVVIEVNAVGVGVADGVQPVVRALLAVVRRGEVAIDHALIGAGRGVREKRFHFGRLGRQPGHARARRAG